ncbi:hypothetical protein HELRODRAFT_183480 [Helobdella robusta]|uniref:Uncharacterized protein n=1 Tax=Helobdella robusta TaxID=6412 RepID=T1FJQ9_HELRO|nr:hypothetical protein HELRODRAFT_183480 [Helobdella robusta]ESO11167.1 hypothetical protein HELRODRAFT_183480 [Helobdella robusta]
MLSPKLNDEDVEKMFEIMNGIYKAAMELETHFISVSKSVNKQNEKIAIGEEILKLASKKMEQTKVMAQKTQHLKREKDKRNCFITTVVILVMILGVGCSVGYLWSLFDRQIIR